MASKPEQHTLLTGLDILDLADEKAGFATRLLADMGARVVKVERPGGDPSRKIGPFLRNGASPQNSLPFFYNNTNKQSVTLDLETRKGRSIFLRLVKKVDAIVETFPPGYLGRFALDYETLETVNPHLIFVSVTGFGQSGPRKNVKVCDLTASAYGGWMYGAGSPSADPLKAYGDQSYFSASLFAAAGILLALRGRAKTGRGERIDISLQESVAATLEHVMVRYFADGVVHHRRESLHWNEDFVVLPCKDGFIHGTLIQKWETLVEWLDSEGMAEDLKEEKWLDESYRRRRIGRVIEILGKWTRGHTIDDIFEIAQLMRFPWAPVQSPDEVVDCPQLKARNFFVKTECPRTGNILMHPGLPFKFSGQSDLQSAPPPLPGEHNERMHEQGFGASVESPKSVLSSEKQSKSSNGGILQGLRILDFTRIVAGPFATRILADFGAEVIKIQTAKMARGIELNDTPYFAAWNRNKRSITLDMEHLESREMFLELVRISDVVVENFSPRVMPNWNLNYDNLRQSNEKLIMLSMSGMGQTGPWKDYVAFGPTVQSLGGLTHMTSYERGAPMGLGHAYGDMISGLYGAVSILAALEQRERTGQGKYIDLSEYEAVCASLGPVLMDARADQTEITPMGNNIVHPPAAPHGCYPCRGEDRWCVVAVFSEDEWRALSGVIGNPAWSREDRFSSPANRIRHRDELNTFIREWMKKHEAARVVEDLQRAGVPAGVVQNAADLANDPQLLANGFFTSLEHPTLGPVKTETTPIHFKNHRNPSWRAAPLLGEANQYVFGELLGMNESVVQSYIRRGIIA